jgi:peptidoglycan/LPS O-acetylase OafA/YrhL
VYFVVKNPAFAALVTLVIAEVSWYVLEKPFNGLKRYFEYSPRQEAMGAMRTPRVASASLFPPEGRQLGFGNTKPLSGAH